MQRTVGVVGLLACALAGLACARDLARASSGAIGCAPDEIEIDDVSIGWAETSWAAACRGTSFRCAGEHAPSCTPSAMPPTGPSLAPPPAPASATVEPTCERCEPPRASAATEDDAADGLETAAPTRPQ